MYVFIFRLIYTVGMVGTCRLYKVYSMYSMHICTVCIRCTVCEYVRSSIVHIQLCVVAWYLVLSIPSTKYTKYTGYNVNHCTTACVWPKRSFQKKVSPTKQHTAALGHRTKPNCNELFCCCWNDHYDHKWCECDRYSSMNIACCLWPACCLVPTASSKRTRGVWEQHTFWDWQATPPCRRQQPAGLRNRGVRLQKHQPNQRQSISNLSNMNDADNKHK